MDYRNRGHAIRARGVVAASVLWLLAAGCGKATAPVETGKTAGPGTPAVAAATKNQGNDTPRVAASVSRDAALVAAVKAALAADARMKTFAIDVRANNGAVELFGTVDARVNFEKAERIAAAVDGVKSIKNHIVLVSGS
jgi:hyperosmotically inducible periplasmic protein